MRLLAPYVLSDPRVDEWRWAGAVDTSFASSAEMCSRTVLGVAMPENPPEAASRLAHRA